MTASGISAVIPVRNGAPHLAEAIESCLAQTLPPLEIIVVDDGSEDGSADIAARFGPPVVVVRQDWSGAAAAINLGAARAAGPLIAFLDHDDLWLPEKLGIQRSMMAQGPALDAVFCMATQFISPEVDDAQRARLAVPAEPQPGLCASAMLVGKAAFGRAGPFAGGRDATGFMLWFLRARENGLRFAVAPDVLMRRRVHANNSGIRDKAVNREMYLAAAREMAQRHRRTPD